MRNRFVLLGCLMIGMVAACQPNPDSVAQDRPPTATLAPIVSQTPRLTATPVPTRTPIPTDTPIPDTPTATFTPSRTPTPTEPPPVMGIVNSLQRVNVRTGPGVTYRDFAAIDPGTGVEVIGQSSDGRWLNVLLDDGDEGWMAASLLRVQPTPTPFPTVTPEPDEELLDQSTPLPTSIIGGAAVTPTPPAAVAQDATAASGFTGEGLVFEPTESLRDLFQTEDDDDEDEPETATPRGETSLESTPVLFTNTPSPTPTETPVLVVDESVLPVIDVDAINATATALAESGAANPTATETPTATEPPADDEEAPLADSTLGDELLTPEDGRTITLDTDDETATDTPPPADEIVIGEADVVTTPDADATAIPTARVSTGGSDDSLTNPDAVIRNGVDVLAYCDDESFDATPPNNLKAGSTVDVYWVWFASTEQQIRDHLNAANYDIRVDGNRLQRLRQYRQPIQQVGTDYAVYWYAPVGPLLPGEHEITYSVTWQSTIFDGYQFFGPGTNALTEEGSCVFTVYE